MSQVFFRGKSYTIDISNDNSKKRLRSGQSVENFPILNRFIYMIAKDVELNLSQLENHAVFVEQGKIISKFSDRSSVIFMHLKQICSVCQITENDFGTDTDGPIFTMFCGHTIHRSCFDSLTQKNCPLCRNSSLNISSSSNASTSSYSLVSSNPTVVTPYPSFFIPRWDANDNACLSNPYQILDNGYTARPSKGMMILHTEQFTTGLIYKFSVHMSSQPYCAAVLMIGNRQDKKSRDFGADFQCCPTLHEKIGKDKIDFVIDMIRKTAICTYNMTSYGGGEIKFENLPEKVYVAVAVKSIGETNSFARILRTEED